MFRFLEVDTRIGMGMRMDLCMRIGLGMRMDLWVRLSIRIGLTMGMCRTRSM